MRRTTKFLRKHVVRIIGGIIYLTVIASPLFVAEPWNWYRLLDIGSTRSAWQALFVAFVLSIAVAGWIVPLFHWMMGHVLSDSSPTEDARWPWLGVCASDVTGFIERSVFFTTLVFMNIETAPVAMALAFAAAGGMLARWLMGMSVIS